MMNRHLRREDKLKLDRPQMMKSLKDKPSLYQMKWRDLLDKLRRWNDQYKWLKFAIPTLLVALYTLSRGDYSLKRYIQIKQREYKVSDELGELQPRFVRDSLRLENIRSNPDEVEYIARERYYMKNEGEDIYIMKPEPERNSSKE